MAFAEFDLRPFQPSDRTAAFSLSGTAIRQGPKLSLRYLLTGPLAQLQLPKDDDSLPHGASDRRQDRLWEQTCLEFFLTASPAPQQLNHASPYWEFNLSPAGDWNVFALSGYRAGLREAQEMTQLPFSVIKTPTQLQLLVDVDIAALDSADLLAARSLKLGVSAVVVMATGEESFWAIAHPHTQADFHHPGSFVLTL